MKVHYGIARIIGRRRVFAILALKLFTPAQASSRLPSTMKCASELQPFARARSTTGPW